MKLSFTILALASVAFADKWRVHSDEEYIGMACKAGIEAAASFCPNTTAKSYACVCGNAAELGSWVTCAYNRTSVYDEKMDAMLVELCAAVKKPPTLAQIHAQYQNASNYIKDLDKKVPKGTFLNYPIRGHALLKGYNGEMNANRSRFGNQDKSNYLGIAFVSAVGLVVLVAGLFNWLHRMLPSISNSKFLQKNLFLPAAFNGQHLNATRFGYIPDRLETLLIVCMWVYCILACSILGISWHEGDTRYPSHSDGYGRYYGDRTGIIAVYQLPLLFLLPGRNNFLQWVTRWKYSRFITFHKWLARIVVLEMIVHGIAFAIESYVSGRYVTRLKADWYICGITATVAAGCMWASASYIFRHYWYEVFYVIHLCLAAVFTASCWIHVDDQEYQEYLWTCIAIWLFDRLFRLIRLVQFGLFRKAKVEAINGGTLKLTIPYNNKVWKPFPGAHAFVSFLTPKTFWQSHPFTVVTSASDKDHIYFYCKVKSGVTLTIQEYLQKQEKGSAEIRVCVEGPYAIEPPYQQYDTSVFVATGNGFPGVFPAAYKLLSSDSKTNVKLHWAIKNYDALNWFKEQLNELKALNFRPTVYISNPESANVTLDLSGSSSDSGSEKNSVNEKTLNGADEIRSHFDFVDFVESRMDCKAIVEQELAQAEGSVAFGACGHPLVNDDLRAAVVANVATFKGKLDYYEDTQVW